MLGTRLDMSTADRPRTDGQTERELIASLEMYYVACALRRLDVKVLAHEGKWSYEARTQLRL